jgi:hypothetical protein
MASAFLVAQKMLNYCHHVFFLLYLFKNDVLEELEMM